MEEMVGPERILPSWRLQNYTRENAAFLATSIWKVSAVGLLKSIAWILYSQ